MNEKKRLEYIYQEYPPDIDELKVREMCVCFCRYCGEYILILPHAVETYPVRKRDMSRVIEESENDFKWNLNYEGITYIRRENGIEKQCRLYCKHCKLFIAYRLAPPGETSKYFYIVKGSITTDPDIMLHEVKNYKLQIPPYVQRDPDNPSHSSIVFIHVEYGKEANRIVNVTNNTLNIELKYLYTEEGRANALLIQFISSLLNISSLNCSLVYEDSKLAMRIEDMDYEELFLKIERIIAKVDFPVC